MKTGITLDPSRGAIQSMARIQPRPQDVVAHDAWFGCEVEVAVKETDAANAEWNSQRVVKRQSAIKRAAWRSQSSAVEQAED